MKDNIIEYNKFTKSSDLDYINDVFLKGNKGGCIYFTSGTTSKPKAISYTNDEIEYFSDYFKWFCEIENVHGGKRVAVLMDQAFWGIGFFTTEGHIKAGNSVVPIDTDLDPESIVSILKIIKPDIISSIPSVINELIPYIKEINFSILELTGELLKDSTRKKFEKILNCVVYDAYGLTECPIGVECSFHNGYHYNKDFIELEIYDNQNNKIVKNEEYGELLISIKSKKAKPLTRYKSGDYCKITYEQCKCGSKHPRVFFKKRINKIYELYEGYKLSHSEIISIINDVYKKEMKTIIKYQNNCLNIKIKDGNKILNNLVKKKISSLSYEIIHILRTNRLEIIIE